jgi:rod shape-determining protein MreD
MRFLILLPFIYVAGVLETSLGDVLQVGHVGPDLMALLAVVWVIWVPGPGAFLAAGIIGLASDFCTPGRLGLAMAAFLVAGYLLTRLGSRLPLRRIVLQVPTVFVSVTALALTLGVGYWLLGDSSSSLGTLSLRALGVGIYTAGLSVPVVMILSWTRKPRLGAT